MLTENRALSLTILIAANIAVILSSRSWLLNIFHIPSISNKRVKWVAGSTCL